MFTRAIVRSPNINFARGLTTVDLGVPDYDRAIGQHNAYCAALRQCGLNVTQLEPDEKYPDSTFVEDTAVPTKHSTILARPGAIERQGEVDAIAKVLARFYSQLHSVDAPGTLDGGDICEAGAHFFVGLSRRTNEAGAKQLAALLDTLGYTTSIVDIRRNENILHLKSGVAYLGDNRLALIDALAGHEAFRGFDLVRVNAGEEYVANCVRVNDYILVAAGFPVFEKRLKDLGYQTIVLEMSEFQKMDGGLSCLSLRF